MTTIEQWLYFLRYADDTTKQAQLQQILEQKEGIQTAMTILQQISADEKLRTQIRFREKAQRDQLARENAARKEGIKEGEYEKARQIAKKMLATFDDQTIATVTDLSLAEVADLRADMPHA